MRINDFLTIKDTSNTMQLKAIKTFQEEDAYNKYTALNGDLITDWIWAFIMKVENSMVNNEYSSMSSKELAVFTRYFNNSVMTADDLTYDPAIKLDAYLASLTDADFLLNLETTN